VTRTVFVFAGGGTGGHIFPALAIAEQLAAQAGPRARPVFVVSDRPLDAEILRKEGVEFHALAAKPFGVRPRALGRFLRAWGPAVRESRRLLGELQSDGAAVRVVAMGGFVAAPVAQAAKVERVPLTLVNMDAVPGKANRWVARKASRVVTSTPVPGMSWQVVPPIVRAAALAGQDARACRRELGLEIDTPTLLVTGASQGARSINRLVMRLLADEPGAFRGWQVIHQTGAGEEEAVAAAYDAAGVAAIVAPFFDAMGLAWGVADLAVSRAGAGSVAEAWANHVPTVFLPYPYHKDEHQRFNAQPLEKAGGALIVKDRIDDAANAADAGKVILELMGSAAKRAGMRTALVRLGPADGAKRIADLLLRA
jgi:UDP-N-acetylglucosamine--N-acetylmuramyl-(pentapeptide) pyrophosphoryl-undecaprenol N-acetylglucosamine transferase